MTLPGGQGSNPPIVDPARSNANLSLLHLYDPSTAPGGTVRFKRVLAHIASRLDGWPMFRLRLQLSPLVPDARWVEDERFDLEDHVHHIALPHPGDWRQFCIQVSRLHARALDQGRPLWEVYVIEGLDGMADLPAGSFCLMFKTQLAAATVAQAGELTRLLHDAEASPPAPPPPPPWFPAPAPGPLRAALREAGRALGSPLQLAAPAWRRFARWDPTTAALAADRGPQRHAAQATRFNAVVSPYRVFESRRFAQAELDRIRRRVDGATVDDLVIAVCGGALMRYLHDKDEVPAAGLWARVPNALTGSGRAATAATADADADARFGDGAVPSGGWQCVPLGHALADPVGRLARIRDHRRGAEGSAAAAGQPPPAGLAARASAAARAWVQRSSGRPPLSAQAAAPMAHCTIVPVPMPEAPLFLCGARMVWSSALLPLADGSGLAFAVSRCEGHLVVSATSCRELMPDPALMGRALVDSFDEYRALATAAARRRRPGRSARATAGAAAPLEAPPKANASTPRPRRSARSG